MMIKYSFAPAGEMWGIYGLDMLILNEQPCLMLIDIPENLGRPLDQTFAAVATEVVQLLMAELHVDDPAGVQWMHARQTDPLSNPIDWRDVYLIWHNNRYWIAPPQAF